MIKINNKYIETILKVCRKKFLGERTIENVSNLPEENYLEKHNLVKS